MGWLRKQPAPKRKHSNPDRTFEEQFAAAEELPIEIPVPVAAPQSVLSPATKHLSLIEIMNRQRQKQEKP